MPASVAFDAMLAVTDDIAIFISGMRAYSNGVEFALQARTRHDLGEHGTHLPDAVLGAGRDGGVLLGVEFADGRWCTNLAAGPEPPGVSAREQPALVGGGGGADARSAEAEFFLSPLPPPGDIRFICAWPGRGIAETAVTAAADPIIEATSRSQVLWPREPDTEDDEDFVPARPDLTGMPWFAEHLGADQDSPDPTDQPDA